MEIGKVSENVLKRAVFKQIKKKNNEVLCGSHIGEDCAVLGLGEEQSIVFSTNPVTVYDKKTGFFGIHRVVNDILSDGAKPIAVMSCVLLPAGTREKRLHDLMEVLIREAAEQGMELIGGHTEVSPVVMSPVIVLTGVGVVLQKNLCLTGEVKPGDEIVMTKWAALEGTYRIVSAKREQIMEKLPEYLIAQCEEMKAEMSISKEAMIAQEAGVRAMHNLSEGGIFGALWDFGEASGVGITVDLKKIPIRQETIEVCEIFNANPYMLVSGGSLLLAASNGNFLVDRLAEEGIPASVIGYATEGNDRVIINGEEKRFLERPSSDELYKIII